MNDFNIRRHRINQIFISHLHGDHIFGLIGLLTSYSLGQRAEKMDIFGPAGIQEFLDVQIKHSKSHLTYPLNVHVVDPTRLLNVIPEKLAEHGIGFKEIAKIKKGENVINALGEEVDNEHKQAAIIARDATVKKLLIGHFSSRYHDLNVLLNEATGIFNNTQLAIEGETFSVELRRIE